MQYYLNLVSFSSKATFYYFLKVILNVNWASNILILLNWKGVSLLFSWLHNIVYGCTFDSYNQIGLFEIFFALLPVMYEEDFFPHSLNTALSSFFYLCQTGKWKNDISEYFYIQMSYQMFKNKIYTFLLQNYYIPSSFSTGLCFP